MQQSLWGQEFTITPEDSKVKQNKIINKINNPKKTKTVVQTLKSKNVSIRDKINIITENVNRILGGYSSNTIVIKTHEELIEYINKAIVNEVIAIDTETNNSLDPLTCKLMGACIYTPGMPSAYIPINHVNLLSHERLDWQLTESDIKEQFDRLHDTKIIMHNGKFDYQVIYCTCDCDLDIYWDSMIAAKVLDENEHSAGLKQQYINKIDNSIEKYSIDHLFDIEYALLDPELFALYAATDAYMTYKLYEWQLKEFEKNENYDLLDLFMKIEMPCVKVTANMELTGICLDLEYTKRLSEKYHKLYDEIHTKLIDELNKLKPKIDEWRNTLEANVITQGKSNNERLEFPPNVSSPTQLAILLYDVLKTPVIDKKTPRGTGVNILKMIDLPICKLILKEREILKLINTYIDKLPEVLSERDGRLHCHFNQYGADTGRFSSSDPNLQNIPSHNNEIRMMFTASPGYVMLGSDYSQQEPRLLAHYSQDENMINAYKNKKDLYAMIASRVYHNNYEDNLEFNPITGAMQPDGKTRRTACKTLLLGIQYGMGTKAIAERMNVSNSEAIEIKNSFFKAFPKVQNWFEETETFARKNGYVCDLWGRRRRLPDLLKNEYEIISHNKTINFNPLLHTSGEHINDSQIQSLLNELYKCKWKSESDKIKQKAKQLGYEVKDSTNIIAKAKRQSVNARIQGGAASMSKRAMINVSNNKELNKLGFRLLIAVHDELIGECPIENKERCKELLSQEMINAALPEVTVPMKCDADDFPSWYYDVYSSEIKKEYDKNGHNFEKLCYNHTEMLSDELKNIIDEKSRNNQL